MLVSSKKCSPRCSQTEVCSASAAPMAVVPTARSDRSMPMRAIARCRAGRPAGQGADVDHDAVGVGQDREVARIGDGAREPVEHRPRGRAAARVALGGAAIDRRRTGSNTTRCCGRRPAARQRCQERASQGRRAHPPAVFALDPCRAVPGDEARSGVVRQGAVIGVG